MSAFDRASIRWTARNPALSVHRAGTVISLDDRRGVAEGANVLSSRTAVWCRYGLSQTRLVPSCEAGVHVVGGIVRRVVGHDEHVRPVDATTRCVHVRTWSIDSAPGGALHATKSHQVIDPTLPVVARRLARAPKKQLCAASTRTRIAASAFMSDARSSTHASGLSTGARDTGMRCFSHSG